MNLVDALRKALMPNQTKGVTPQADATKLGINSSEAEKISPELKKNLDKAKKSGKGKMNDKRLTKEQGQ